MDDPSFFVRLGSFCFFLLRLNRKQPHNHLLHVHRRRGWFLPHASWNDSQCFFFFTCPLTFSFHACVSISASIVTAADATIPSHLVTFHPSLLLIFFFVCVLDRLIGKYPLSLRYLFSKFEELLALLKHFYVLLLYSCVYPARATITTAFSSEIIFLFLLNWVSLWNPFGRRCNISAHASRHFMSGPVVLVASFVKVT